MTVYTAVPSRPSNSSLSSTIRCTLRQVRNPVHYTPTSPAHSGQPPATNPNSSQRNFGPLTAPLGQRTPTGLEYVGQQVQLR